MPLIRVKDIKAKREPACGCVIQCIPYRMTLTRASGKPFTLKISWTRLRGKVVLEVIQPLGDESLWSKFLETKGEGIRHIAVNVPNWDYIDNEPSNIIIEPMEEDLYDRVFSNAR